MKYFKKAALFSPLLEDSIDMCDEHHDSRIIFTMEKFGDHINFVSEDSCCHRSRIMSKKEAVEALKEAIKWIENDE